jgi:hypothetical protein
MDCMELHGLELCIKMAMAAYIDEGRLMVRADWIGCERFERLREEASDLFEEEDRQEIRRGDQAVRGGGMVRGWLVENGWREREVLGEGDNQ